MTDNELIAEFMGRDWKSELKWIEDEDSRHVGSMIEVNLHVDDLDYHENWASLMPVVEKIESLENCRFGFTLDVLAVYVIDYKENETELVNVDRPAGESRIESTYAAVVEFIKWYNSKTVTP